MTQVLCFVSVSQNAVDLRYFQPAGGFGVLPIFDPKRRGLSALDCFKQPKRRDAFFPDGATQNAVLSTPSKGWRRRGRVGGRSEKGFPKPLPAADSDGR
jgi:hypothetical protein